MLSVNKLHISQKGTNFQLFVLRHKSTAIEGEISISIFYRIQNILYTQHDFRILDSPLFVLTQISGTCIASRTQKAINSPLNTKQ